MFFPEGSENGAVDCTDIAITEDSVFEGSHSFTVQVLPEDGQGTTVATANPQSATVIIMDNDSKAIL